MIVSPVSRTIGVSDIARSVAFYRDVLGFEVKEESGVTELLEGAARIELEPRGQGSAVVLFETGDVDAMRAGVLARGGAASEIEKVNWIKMRMFQVSDPDGHTLWFGQSYNVPDSPGPRPMMKQALPELPLDDVAAGVAYYRDVLGFKINHQQDDVGVMDRDAITLVLIARTERHKGIGSAYVYIENADSLYQELKAKGAQVQGEPVSWPWGLRDFCVLDIEGNRIRFGQPFE